MQPALPAGYQSRHYALSGSPAPTLFAAPVQPVPKEDLNDYLELHERQSSLSSQLRTINDNINRHKEEKSLQLKVSTKRIEVDLRNKHDTEKENLKHEHKRQHEELEKRQHKEVVDLYRMQKQETDKKNEEHARLKAKLTQEENDLEEYQRVRLQAKNAIKKEFDRKRESLTREQLLNMVDRLTPFAIDKKRKRSDGEGEEK